MLPWLVTMALVMAIAAVLGVAGVTDSPGGQLVAVAIAVPVVIAGIVVTGVRSRRTPVAALVLEIDAQSLRLVDARTSALCASTPLGAVRIECGTKRYRGRGFTWDAVVLALLVPGRARPLTIGIPDMRYTWRGDTRDLGAADYVVGGADWLALVDRLGVRPRLNVGPG
jgi:hypothetical protein